MQVLLYTITEAMHSNLKCCYPVELAIRPHPELAPYQNKGYLLDKSTLSTLFYLF